MTSQSFRLNVIIFEAEQSSLFSQYFIHGRKSLPFTAHGDYEKSGIEKIENKFCFYGAWNRTENSAGLEWFLENVYPNLPASVDFQFAVIGGGICGIFLRTIGMLSI